MTTMVDDCTREVFAIISKWAYATGDQKRSTQETAEAAVKAVLARLREPTEEMLKLGAYNNEGCLSDGCDAKAIARHCWITMIDTAAKDAPP